VRGRFDEPVFATQGDYPFSTPSTSEEDDLMEIGMSAIE
jgi:hypothetical protein